MGATRALEHVLQGDLRDVPPATRPGPRHGNDLITPPDTGSQEGQMQSARA